MGYTDQSQRCGHAECREEPMACYLDDDWLSEPPTVTEYLCPSHAVERGYCNCCGLFSAGMESFDFLHPGLCDNCYDQVQADSEEDDDFEDWEYDEYGFEEYE